MNTTHPIDCLFVHVPKFSNYYKPLDDFMNVTFMPMGVFAMADLLASRGFGTQIVHLGVEWIEDKNFSIIEFMKGREIKIASLPLFWHYQSFDVIEVAKKIKKHFPDVFVVLGGFTASYFASEILTTFKEVDAVIKGQGEEPLLSLTREIKRGNGKNLRDIPNLSWRDGDEIVVNEKQYFASGEDLDRLNFTNLSLLKNHRSYVKCFSFPLAWVKGLSKEENYKKASIRTTFFPLCVGRGCPVACSWCGGSQKAQHKINLQKKVIFRSHEKVIESITEAGEYGYETMHVSFDPYPKSDYYIGLFKKIRERGVKTSLYFESWAIPTPEFVREFKKTFEERHSVIAISPESGSEGIRKRNRGYYFSNEDFFGTLDLMEGLGVRFDIFFSIGLPFETLGDAYKTKTMIKKIRDKYKKVGRLMTWSIQLEPGSPAYEDPPRFGMKTERKCFMDFYRAHADYFSDTYSSLGYNIPGFFEGTGPCPDARTFAKRLQAFKCRHFCFLHPDPRTFNSPLRGRLYCKFREITWLLKGKGRKNLPPRKVFN